MISFWMFGKSILALAIFAGASVLAEGEETCATPPDEYFKQYVDHFTITDQREWKQRYNVIKDYYKDGGPVFLLLSAQWPISGELLPTTTVTAYAKKFGALVFQLEHRFYGKSQPTSDVSTANLIYLSRDQVLADAAYFIKGMTAEHKLPEGTKWIAFGVSFGAKMAAWMRDKYPHLVYAAVANSAPLLSKFNFYEYYGAVAETLKSINPECATTVQEAVKKVKELLNTPEGQKVVNEKFQLCEPIDTSNKNNVAGLFITIAEIFSEVARFNGSDSYGTLTINGLCDILVDTSIGEPIDRLATVNSKFTEASGCACTVYEQESMIEGTKETSWDADLVAGSSRQWYYQNCAENGHFATSVQETDFFFGEIPFEFFMDRCKTIYGDNFGQDLASKAEYRSNLLYGGLDIQATRVAYIYSTTDPYRVTGNLETKIAESPVFVINGGPHDAFFSEITENSPPSVKEVWGQVEDLVGKWCSS